MEEGARSRNMGESRSWNVWTWILSSGACRRNTALLNLGQLTKHSDLQNHEVRRLCCSESIRSQWSVRTAVGKDRDTLTMTILWSTKHSPLLLFGVHFDWSKEHFTLRRVGIRVRWGRKQLDKSSPILGLPSQHQVEGRVMLAFCSGLGIRLIGESVPEEHWVSMGGQRTWGRAQGNARCLSAHIYKGDR